MSMTTDSKAELEPTKVFRLRGITYVPMWNGRKYVGPGYPRHQPKEWTADQLVLAGAKESVEMLWPRAGRKRGQA